MAIGFAIVFRFEAFASALFEESPDISDISIVS
jgi:hypothetical protein